MKKLINVALSRSELFLTFCLQPVGFIREQSNVIARQVQITPFVDIRSFFSFYVISDYSFLL